MADPIFDDYRRRHPDYQGLDGPEIIQAKAQQKLGRALTDSELKDLFKSSDMETSNPVWGFGRGVLAGLNPVPESITRAILPKEWADTVTGLEDTLPGEGYGHAAGEIVGNIGGLLLPAGILGKVGKGLSEAERIAKASKAINVANAVQGFGKGVKNVEHRGQFYNEGAGVAPRLLGGGLEAAMNVIPGFSSLGKAVAGNAALGAASMTPEMLLRAENGVDSGFTPGNLATGGAAGAVFGGGAHVALHSLPSYLKQKIAQKPVPQAAKDAAAQAAAVTNPGAVPAPNPEVEALLQKVQGASGARGPQAANDLELINQLNGIKEQIAAHRAFLDVDDPSLYPQNGVTVLRTGDPERKQFRLKFDTRLGNMAEAALEDPEGSSFYVDSSDLLDNYWKRLDLPDSDLSAVIKPGYRPLQSVLDDTIKGEPVSVLGVNPRGRKAAQKYLVAFKDTSRLKPGEAGTLDNPLEVSMDALERMFGAFRKEREAEVTPEMAMASVGKRAEPGAAPLHTAESLLKSYQEQLKALEDIVNKRKSQKAARTAKNAPPPKAEAPPRKGSPAPSLPFSPGRFHFPQLPLS